MEQKNNSLIECLNDLGYPSNFIQEISEELNKLFKDIDFESIKQRASQAEQVRDTEGFIKSIKDLMFLLEGKSIYRPDAPIHLIKQLVNGLNLKNQDIFYIISRSRISLEEKLIEMEFLASCAAITQLGYILLKCIVPDVKAASSGEHVFLVIDSFSHDSNIFVDFSIDSVKEIDINIYDRNEKNWKLKKDQDFSTVETETVQYLTEYYSFFHLTRGIGLNHNIHNNLGLAYDKLGRYEEAIDELHAALRLDPDYIEVHNNLAVTYHKMGMTVEAEKELMEAIRQNPGYLEAHCNLGNIYAIQKRNPEALNEFREALRIDPNYASPHNNIGNLFLESGMYEEAIKEFKEALDIDPIFPEAHYGTGLAHYELKNYEKASQAFIKAVYASPELMECIPDKLILKVKQGISRLV